MDLLQAETFVIHGPVLWFVVQSSAVSCFASGLKCFLFMGLFVPRAIVQLSIV